MKERRVSIINLSSIRRRNAIRSGLLITLFLSICIIVVTIYGQNVGNFVINVEYDAAELGLTMSETEDFKNPTVRLYASSLPNATNISGFDIPKHIKEGDGNKNDLDRGYIAYSFYLKNCGQVKLSYTSTITIVEENLNVSNAIRLMIISETNEKENIKIYAKTPIIESGFTEAENKFPNSINVPLTTFDGNIVCNELETGFEVDQVMRYTIVLWLEGDDPECIDAILGGFIRLSMEFKCLASEK